jgi:hypothetical protein
MFRLVRGRTLLLLVAVLCAATGGTLAVAFGDEDGPRAQIARAATGSGCAGKSAPTVAAVQLDVAKHIYSDELKGTETVLDTSRVRGYAPLLSALEHGETTAVAAAVHALVYKPQWHIVRLRVSQGGRVLADVGGPHVIAPVTGTLRSHGRTLGHYVTSVQDDLGYVKLVTRFIGAPVDLYQHGSLVMGTLRPAPSAPRDGATVTVGGRSYLVANVAASAFPAGPLQASLFVPQPASGQSCSALRVAAWGSVARHIALRLQPLSAHYQDLASVVRAVTGGRVFVRAGAKRLVTGGPRRIPATGTVRYAGRTWPVYSWQPAAGQRVYFLTPPG